MLTSDWSPFTSDTFVHSNSSSFMAFSQAFLSLSIDTPNTANPLLLYSLYIFFSSGNWALQGLHQEAQKSIYVYLFLEANSIKETNSPVCNAGKEKSGAELASPATSAFTLIWVS